MHYVYTAMWFAIGLILIISMARENKIFYLAGGYFILLGLWWLLDILLDGVMFTGALGVGFKVFSGVMLVALSVYFIRQYKKNREKGTEDETGRSVNKTKDT